MKEDLTVTQSVLGALVATLVLVGLHLAAPRIRKLPFVPERATGSFAGGLAVAYFTIFYALERLAARTGPGTFATAGHPSTGHPSTGHPSTGHPSTGQERGSSSGVVYGAHLGSFLVYNALITYTMALRLRTRILFAVPFTVAMGLHFVLTDRGLQEHYPDRFRRDGRIALGAALIVGWAADALLAPTSTLLVALLTALLGGSILLNVFKEEVPAATAAAARTTHGRSRRPSTVRTASARYAAAPSAASGTGSALGERRGQHAAAAVADERLPYGLEHSHLVEREDRRNTTSDEREHDHGRTGSAARAHRVPRRSRPTEQVPPSTASPSSCSAIHAPVPGPFRHRLRCAGSAQQSPSKQSRSMRTRNIATCSARTHDRVRRGQTSR